MTISSQAAGGNIGLPSIARPIMGTHAIATAKLSAIDNLSPKRSFISRITSTAEPRHATSIANAASHLIGSVYRPSNQSRSLEKTRLLVKVPHGAPVSYSPVTEGCFSFSRMR